VHAVEASIRQMNRFLDSPVLQANGQRARLLNAVMTGDLADNMQRNETEWVVRLLEGGPLNPNSGSSNPAEYSRCPPGTPGTDEAARYTGVQDYDDYANDNPLFWDPDQPIGQYANWPRYPGLMDWAQVPFQAEGLKVPSYIAFGNHDALYQGTVQTFPTVPPHPPFEQIALGCIKAVYPLSSTDSAGGHLSPAFLQSVLSSNPENVMLVPPDPNRQFVDRPQFRKISETGAQQDIHGFGYVDPAEARASNNTASYYAFSPKRGVRYVVLDTVGDSGTLVAPNSSGSPTPASGSDGNLDDPQWRWLQRELQAAERRDEMVIAFGHHARSSMTNTLPDELAPCTGVDDGHQHDVNPSCDRDPRNSSPLHFGEELISLFNRHPHVVAYVAGHSHENRVAPYRRGPGSVWEIKSPAIADWPPQNRMVEVMDNRDGTLSIFGTIVDIDAPVQSPPSGTAAGGSATNVLASISRTITWNDPQVGPRGTPGPQGELKDRNVELLLRDPRRNPLDPTGRRRCASLSGRIAGKRVHRAAIGRRRRTVRRSYVNSGTKSTRYFDYFCLADGRLVRVGFGHPRVVGRALGRRKRNRARGRAVVILTSSRHFQIKKVRPTNRVRTLRTRLRRERRYRIGRNTYYVINGKRSKLIFRTSRNRVRAIGVGAKSMMRGRRGERRFLRAFRP
jgi:3',5'-cyclic AMP phosphodiesterase CpdA